MHHIKSERKRLHIRQNKIIRQNRYNRYFKNRNFICHNYIYNRYFIYSTVLILLVVSFFHLAYSFSSLSEEENKSDKSIVMFLFWGNGCPHCAKMKSFLAEMKEKYPSLEVKAFEVYFNQSNRELFQKIAKAYNTTVSGVPTVFIDREVIIGYSSSIAQEIEQKIKECIKQGKYACVSPEEILMKANLNKNVSNEKVSNTENVDEKQEENSEFSAISAKGMIVFIVMLSLFLALLLLLSIMRTKNHHKKKK